MLKTRVPALISCALALAAIAAAQKPATIARYTRFEAEFTSSTEYVNPIQEANLEVEFTSAGGDRQTVQGFWDGEKTWKVRFSPEKTGRWAWRTRSVPASDAGLNGKTCEFVCVPYAGNNPLFRHGAIRVSENRRYLAHADGTPFFWLADTGWNVPHLSTAEEWKTYLQDRLAKGFTTIQFVATHFKGFAANAEGRQAYSGRERIAIDPWFFQRLDSRMDLLNDASLLAAPVLAWANEDKMAPWLDPGYFLADDQIILLARYMVARYGAHQTIWMLAGDADYRGEKSERWKKIGRAVFGDHSPRLATMHPGGRIWVADEFRNEPWFSFHGYQSGHRGSDESLRWHTQGSPATDWKSEPHYPIINLEPIYEAHIVMDSSDRHRITAGEVRAAIYWSLLVSPTAGVTYGSMGIWDWEPRPQVPPNHPREGLSPPWREALQHPGARQMKHLKTLFSSVEWWRLRPAQELLAEQPGSREPARFVAVAASEDRSWGLAYLPAGGTITLLTDKLTGLSKYRWFNPRTGEWSGNAPLKAHTFATPDQEDWVLWIGH